MEYAIEVRNLKKQFPGHLALKGIDFTVPRGSIYGFLGPNGAGKTTAIKILLGLISATEGSIKVLGSAVRFGGSFNYLGGVGYLPQDPVFPEGLSGREALSLVAGIYKMDKYAAARRIEMLLDEFQLADAAKRKVNAYSRGMKQRLGVAAVLLTEPELLILDEPVSALDPEGRFKVLETTASLRGKATVFFSSHILADVERVCDRVAIVDKGEKLMEKETEDILDEYAMEQYVISVSPAHLQRALELLSTHAAVRQAERRQDSETLLVTSHPGKAATLSEELLPYLIREHVTVTEFMRRRVDLEEVFFKVLQHNGRSNGGGHQ